MGNTTFLFAIKEKIEIDMPNKMIVRIVLLLLSVTVKIFCYKLHEQMNLTFKTKSSLKTQILFDLGSQGCYVNEKVGKFKYENYSYRQHINEDFRSN